MSEFRVIPGYDAYAVNSSSVIKSIERDLVLSQYMLNGYLIVDTFRGSATETLPVHRAVALAWVDNPEPSRFLVVNHKDGVPLNNEWTNLEWTDYSGNNYHAVNTGLRRDNIPCKVRDFETGSVRLFSSVAQAAEFMGCPKDTPIYMLFPKKYGSLIKDRYEFKYQGDEEPWFYEYRKERIRPARYLIQIIGPDGDVWEIFSTRQFLKDFQLYGCPERSIPKLAEYASGVHKDHSFIIYDSYEDPRFVVERATAPSVRQPILARRRKEVLEFSSLTQCAKHFGVDRSSIFNRLDCDNDLDGWTFTKSFLP